MGILVCDKCGTASHSASAAVFDGRRCDGYVRPYLPKSYKTVRCTGTLRYVDDPQVSKETKLKGGRDGS